MEKIQIVLTTTDSEQEAKKLAKELVRKKLAACVQIIPGVTSIYRWDDEFVEDQEFIVQIKTAIFAIEDVFEYISKHHSYDEPEIISIDIEQASKSYKRWVLDQMM
jgi:periplasmic divalent cation tolerance protein